MGEELSKTHMKTGHEWDRIATIGANLEKTLAELEVKHSEAEVARQKLLVALRAVPRDIQMILTAYADYTGTLAGHNSKLELLVGKAS